MGVDRRRTRWCLRPQGGTCSRYRRCTGCLLFDTTENTEIFKSLFFERLVFWEMEWMSKDTALMLGLNLAPLWDVVLQAVS